ncbi:MAG: hypothetical protein JOY96_09065 [Verrucomicrobia bacterium]|nr:hypothetical protein [Verrucomicrobiota bacterium]MBV9672939.1 hypothetical protein [Verrucomicrobiota bacterium]
MRLVVLIVMFTLAQAKADTPATPSGGVVEIYAPTAQSAEFDGLIRSDANGDKTPAHIKVFGSIESSAAANLGHWLRAHNYSIERAEKLIVKESVSKFKNDVFFCKCYIQIASEAFDGER